MNARSKVAVGEAFPLSFVRKKPVQRHGIVEAYLFFYDAIRDYLTSDGGEPTARFSSLFRALTQQIQLVSLELEEQDDPQVIFETLNARGEPLSRRISCGTSSSYARTVVVRTIESFTARTGGRSIP